jgi:hypothetical protein
MFFPAFLHTKILKRLLLSSGEVTPTDQLCTITNYFAEETPGKHAHHFLYKKGLTEKNYCDPKYETISSSLQIRETIPLSIKNKHHSSIPLVFMKIAKFYPFKHFCRAEAGAKKPTTFLEPFWSRSGRHTAPALQHCLQKNLYFKKCKNCSLLFTFTVIFFLKI